MSKIIDNLKCVTLYLLLCFIIIITLTKDFAASHELGGTHRRTNQPLTDHPTKDFSSHQIVRPLVHHGRQKRRISSTREDDNTHAESLAVTLTIDSVDHILDLRLNKGLLPDNHLVRYQKDGQKVDFRPKKEDAELCHYTGKIKGLKDSWAAVSTCDGMRGMFFDGKDTRYIENGGEEGLDSPHYIYKHEDLTKELHCGYEGGITNNTEFDSAHSEMYNMGKRQEINRILRYKRSTPEQMLRGPFNANRLSRYVELVLVVDHEEYKKFGENMATVQRQCKDIANIINALYTPLNIFISLVGVMVWSEVDEITLSENGDTTLTNFLVYRKERLVLEIPNDNAQLLTKTQFTGGVVGKALKGPICTYQFSGGVAMDHSSVVGLVATTIAHEMGHNFGMEHDTDDCQCPDARCIMSPSSTSISPTHWSSCSLEYLALAFQHGMDYCLRNKPKHLYDSPTCGNGFVEAGEQCDCGVGESNAACAACCITDTCMLRANATCATGHCCDLKTCGPSKAGTMCRTAEHECDLPEFCTGQSEFCPDDIFKMDTEVCDKGKAFCYHGSCRTRSDQCQLLWGPSGESSQHLCYEKNRKGSKNGNCGYNRLKQHFFSCNAEDVLCGMLHCQHLNERLEFGMESVAILSHSFINYANSIIPCRTAIVDLGLNQMDPGLVPDGARCGEGKMCVNQKCMTVEALRLDARSSDGVVCPSDCSGHGVCNSLGHCHCEKGFSPPLCELPGPGGSLDSGPASDPNAHRDFMVAMFVIFLGIIPATLVIMFLTYYSRHNVVLWWKKPRKLSPGKGGLQRRISRGAIRFASGFQTSTNPQNTQSHLVPVPTLTSSDDMSSSLLRSDSDATSPSATANVNSGSFFGHFKGFTLTPIDKTETNNKSNVSNPGYNPDQPVAVISGGYNSTNQNGKEASPKLSSVKSIAETLSSKKNAKILPIHKTLTNNQAFVGNPCVQAKPNLRSAPPVPCVPTVATTEPPKTELVKVNSVQNRIKAFMNNSEKTESTVPALPPVNPGSTARPLISNPILEASTCTAKELISPLQNAAPTPGWKTLGPVRSAPSAPEENGSPKFPKRPLSVANILMKPLPEEPPSKKGKEGISLNRIASFLKQEKPKEKTRKPAERSHSLPKNSNNQIKAVKTVDKAALRNMQISNPILQKDIELPSSAVPVVSDSEDFDDDKPGFVERAQSMRGPVVIQKPNIASFGSMRQPSGVKRPTSIFNSRPSWPPPPRPMENDDAPVETKNQVAVETKTPEYADCISEKQAPLANIGEESPSDNIYAVIEESPPNSTSLSPVKKISPYTAPDGYNMPKPIVNTTSGSAESVGLLGEIVSEIQHRNFDSIYSTSTLARKKKEREKNGSSIMSGDETDSTYVNTDHYKSPGSEYSNMSGGVKSISSAASTTSSGYLNPSALNVPKMPIKPLDNNNKDKVTNNTNVHLASVNLNNSRQVLPSSNSFTKPQTGVISEQNSNKSNVNSKIPTIGRQVTPPSLSRQATPPNLQNTLRNVPQSPKLNSKSTMQSYINSPDLVSSCAVTKTAKTGKSPDVINNNNTTSTLKTDQKSLNAAKNALKPTVAPKNSSDSTKPVLKSAPLPPPSDKKNVTNKLNSSQKSINSNSSNNSVSQKQAGVDKSVTVKSNVRDKIDNKVPEKSKPKPVPKPVNIPSAQSKTNPSLKVEKTARISNVASLQQKFENRKSVTSKVDSGIGSKK